jgi:hypothetical protein
MVTVESLSLSPTPGDVHVLGRCFQDLPDPGHEVGVLLDASAQHAGRTGRETATIAALTMGLPRSRVDEMLQRVSLTPVQAGRRVRNYSLRMRQGLGIATAIVAYFVYSLVQAGASGALAGTQAWWAENGGWFDLNWATMRLFQSEPTGEMWAQLGTSTVLWLIVPLLIGTRALFRSEVK